MRWFALEGICDETNGPIPNKNHPQRVGRQKIYGTRRVTMSTALKVALGMACFAIGAAGVVLSIAMLVFEVMAQAVVTAVLGALFLWFAFRLLRQVRWHND